MAMRGRAGDPNTLGTRTVAQGVAVRACGTPGASAGLGPGTGHPDLQARGRAPRDAAGLARHARDDGPRVGNTSQQVADMLGHASQAITERSYIDGGRAEAAGRRAGWRVLDGSSR